MFSNTVCITAGMKFKYLHIDGMVVLPVDIFMLIPGRRHNSHMRAINASDDVGKPSHCVELSLQKCQYHIM